jgi:preprotein translocase subunit SecG
MYTLIIGFIIFFAVLLVLVILAQNAKGGGLTSQFGGSSASNIIGVKKTGDLLEKLTWGFVVAIMVLSLVASTKYVLPEGRQMPSNEIIDRAGEQSAPADVTPGLNLDTTGQQPSPLDTTK